MFNKMYDLTLQGLHDFGYDIICVQLNRVSNDNNINEQLQSVLD